MKTADVYGKEVENPKRKIDENLIDWLTKTLGPLRTQKKTSW